MVKFRFIVKYREVNEREVVVQVNILFLVMGKYFRGIFVIYEKFYMYLINVDIS